MKNQPTMRLKRVQVLLTQLSGTTSVVTIEDPDDVCMTQSTPCARAPYDGELKRTGEHTLELTVKRGPTSRLKDVWVHESTTDLINHLESPGGSDNAYEALAAELERRGGTKAMCAVKAWRERRQEPEPTTFPFSVNKVLIAAQEQEAAARKLKVEAANPKIALADVQQLHEEWSAATDALEAAVREMTRTK